MEIVIFTIIVLLFSTIIHEITHGSVANLLGDPTAKNAGRLTLNPLKHLDPFGSVILPIITFLFSHLFGSGLIFGYAKPVPINPYNLKDQKWGTVKVAFSGPAANFVIAIIFGLLIRFSLFPQKLLPFFSIVVFYNLLWAFFNLVPIPPLDGSHILFRVLPQSLWKLKVFLYQQGMFLLILFILFGLKFLAIPVFYIYYLISGQSLISF